MCGGKDGKGGMAADQALIFSCPVVAALWIVASETVALEASLGGGWNQSFSCVPTFLSEVWWYNSTFPSTP